MKILEKKKQFLVFIIRSTQTSLHSLHTRQSKGALQMSYQNFQHSEVTSAMPNAAGSPKQPLVNLFSTHTHTHTQKKKKKKKQRKRFSSSWQKVEADTFPRASWQRKPLFVSFFFCYSFEEESLPFPFLQLHFPFFAFLISKWAELQLGQNCFRDRREGWRREETDGDGDGARGEVNKKEELKECGWSGGGGGGGGGGN